MIIVRKVPIEYSEFSNVSRCINSHIVNIVNLNFARKSKYSVVNRVRVRQLRVAIVHVDVVFSKPYTELVCMSRSR